MSNSSPITWFRFRHSKGIDPVRYGEFSAGCRVYVAKLKAYQDSWDEAGLEKKLLGSNPIYQFHGPKLSKNRKIISLGVGGARSYAVVKAFEDKIPDELWAFWPNDFLKELEIDYAGTWYPASRLSESKAKEVVELADCIRKYGPPKYGFELER